MYTIREQKIFHYPLDFVHDIVTDVTQYPKFLYWFKRIDIITKNGNEITANVSVVFKGFKEKYTSKITLSEDENKKIIRIESIGDSPFKFLKSTWILEDKNPGTLVSFSIEFKMKSAFLEKFIGLFLSSVKGHVMQSFELRAKSLYDTKYVSNICQTIT